MLCANRERGAGSDVGLRGVPGLPIRNSVQDGTIRRNRRDLVVLPDPQESESTEEQNAERESQEQVQNNRDPDTAPTENGTRKTRSGRVSKPPVRLEQNWT